MNGATAAESAAGTRGTSLPWAHAPPTQDHSSHATPNFATNTRAYGYPVLLDTVHEDVPVSPLNSSSPVMHDDVQPALPYTGLAGTPATTTPPLRTVDTGTSLPWGTVQETSPATPSLSRTTTFAQPLRQDTLQGISPTTSALSRATTFAHPLRQYTPMQAAIYVGLVKPPDNSSVSVEPLCSTGNCIFEADDTGAVFQTLSMCHSCRDISDEIIGNGASDTPDNYTLPSGGYGGHDRLAVLYG